MSSSSLTYTQCRIGSFPTNIISLRTNWYLLSMILITLNITNTQSDSVTYIPCAQVRWCKDIYPSWVTTDSYIVQIRKWADNYVAENFYIDFTVKGKACMYPSITFEYDGSQNKYITVYDNDDTILAQCTSAGWCSSFRTCISNQPLSVDRIETDTTYQIRVYQSSDFNNADLCNGRLTLFCSQYTAPPTSTPSYAPTSLTDVPTFSPTSAPTPTPTPAPTPAPSPSPTSVPTTVPSNAPSISPSPSPTHAPSTSAQAYDSSVKMSGEVVSILVIIVIFVFVLVVIAGFRHYWYKYYHADTVEENPEIICDYDDKNCIVPSAPELVDNEEAIGTEKVEMEMTLRHDKFGESEGIIDGNEGHFSIVEWFEHDVELNEYNAKYIDLFVVNGFDNVRALMEMTDEDMRSIGINKLGHRKVMLTAIRDLQIPSKD